MMAQATIGELLNAGREMRRWQKTFFRSQPGTEKQMALEQSKAWEKIFDALIDTERQKQLDMFDEPELVQTARGIEKRPVVASVEGEEAADAKTK